MQRAEPFLNRPVRRPCAPHARRRVGALFSAIALSLVALAGSLPGCASSQRGPTGVGRSASSGDSAELVDAANAYNAREFGRAVTLARAAGARESGLQRARARYLEGLSQLQLGNADEAAGALREAVEAADRTLAANARVSLGTAEVARRDFRAAAEAYRRAALILEGDERRRAEELSALCLARVPGAMHPPTAVVSAPLPPAPAPPEPRTATERVVNGMAIEPIAFAIQAGAFSERARAERVAESLAPTAAKAGLTAPRIVQKPRQGQGPVFVVQVGRFPNRAVAGKAMLQFGQSGFTVERALE